jgi:hypothetical protein
MPLRLGVQSALQQALEINPLFIVGIRDRLRRCGGRWPTPASAWSSA